MAALSATFTDSQVKYFLKMQCVHSESQVKQALTVGYPPCQGLSTKRGEK